MDFLTLKKSNCKNCYKCIRHCPVKSIRFSGNQAHIIGNECILCGQCFVVCPQNAKEISSETEKVKVLLSSGEKVIASLAPSFIANYEGAGIGGMRTALKKLGFYDAEETAIGATIVKTEYENMLAEKTRDIVISSCCHSVNLLIQKYFPKELPYLANVLSPMQAHAKDIKSRNPGAKVVFIGPCVAKKDEAAYYEGIVDAVLTYEDLANWLQAENVEIVAEPDETKESRARFFPTTGGILKTMKKDPEYTYLSLDGVENCMAALRDIENGKVHKCFIEMSACAGQLYRRACHGKIPPCARQRLSCRGEIRGRRRFPRGTARGKDAGKEFYGNRTKAGAACGIRNQGNSEADGQNAPGGRIELRFVRVRYLPRKGQSPFSTGKAEISMCLPYLKDKAESFSDCMVNNTPNGLIVLNENLEVQQINAAARRIMNIRSASDVLGEGVVRILDTNIFDRVLKSKRSVRNERTYLAEYKKYVEQTVVYDPTYHLLVCIMRDITDEETERQKKESISRQTVEVADKVVDKQMRIVQEIASLLGETAAETKIALTKLKESISDE